METVCELFRVTSEEVAILYEDDGKRWNVMSCNSEFDEMERIHKESDILICTF